MITRDADRSSDMTDTIRTFTPAPPGGWRVWYVDLDGETRLWWQALGGWLAPPDGPVPVTFDLDNGLWSDPVEDSNFLALTGPGEPYIRSAVEDALARWQKANGHPVDVSGVAAVVAAAEVDESTRRIVAAIESAASTIVMALMSLPAPL